VLLSFSMAQVFCEDGEPCALPRSILVHCRMGPHLMLPPFLPQPLDENSTHAPCCSYRLPIPAQMHYRTTPSTSHSLQPDQISKRIQPITRPDLTPTCRNNLPPRFRIHTPLRELPTRARVSFLTCSPADPHRLLSCGAPQSHITLWDTEAAAEVQTFSDHQQRVWSIAFAPKQPSLFASGSDDHTLRLWNTEQATSTLSVDLKTNVLCVAANPWDAHVFALGTAGHSVAVYDIRHVGKPLAHFPGACHECRHQSCMCICAWPAPHASRQV
jgi:hypothetical protein